MIIGDLFLMATRKKYRFPYRGSVSVEDLWDLGMTALDDVYKSLNREVKKQVEDSLLSETVGDAELQNKLEIVKYVFATKKAEAQARKEEAKNAEKRNRILEILEQKQDESLKNMSEEELRKLLDET